MTLNRRMLVVAVLALGVVGCGTNPSGGNLPQPTKVSDEEAKKNFSDMSAKMYEKMGTKGAPNLGGPGS